MPRSPSSPVPRPSTPSTLRHKVVFAPAGSGKTQQLSDRYIALLAAGVPPERILTLTFTEKAAAEMKERIFSELEKAENREEFRKAKIKEFDGITGKMSFDGKTGDPVKCAVMVKISPAGKFEFHRMVCP